MNQRMLKSRAPIPSAHCNTDHCSSRGCDIVPVGTSCVCCMECERCPHCNGKEGVACISNRKGIDGREFFDRSSFTEAQKLKRLFRVALRM